MYELISGFSIIIRSFILPNPFDSFQYGILINLAIEPILYILTRSIVGIFYTRGSAPAFGSLLYIAFFSINVGLIQVWANLGATFLIGVAIITMYFSSIIIISSKIN